MPPDLRVLLLMSEVAANGGIQRFNRTLLGACAELNVDCDVLALNDSSSARDNAQIGPTVRVRAFDRDKVRFSLAVATAANFGRYDVIVVGHINLLTLTAAVVALKRRSKCRMLLIAHGVEVWSSIGGMRRRALAAVDTILSVSGYTARTIQHQAPEIGESRFTVFPNALGETWTRKFAGLEDEQAELPERFILSVSRLDKGERYKGIVTTLEAFAMIDDPTLHYVIAGRGNDQEFLAGVAARLQVSDRVHFVGGVSDAHLARLYRECLVFVLPSGKEGFGIVFLEAMYFGAPVIGAAAKGALDVIRDEQTGLLVPYGDTGALRDALLRLLTDEELRQRVKIAGRQTVTGAGCFTFNAYVQRWAQVLRPS